MSLRPGRKLPKKFNRAPSSVSRSIAKKYYDTSKHRQRRRSEKMTRRLKHFQQWRVSFLREIRVWGMALLVIIFVIGISVLLFSPTFDVRQITVRRQDPRVNPGTVQELLTPLFQERLVLVTQKQVQAYLEDEYPDLSAVTITKKYPSTLVVSVALKPVVAALLLGSSEGNAPETDIELTPQTASGMYAYITSTGLYEESLVPLSKQQLQTLVLTDWGIKPQPKDHILGSAYFSTILRARDALRRDFGLTEKSIILYLRANEFHIRTDRVTLWFDFSSPLSVQFGRLRELLKVVPFEQIKTYVDLRIANKVVYR